MNIKFHSGGLKVSNAIVRRNTIKRKMKTNSIYALYLDGISGYVNIPTTASIDLLSKITLLIKFKNLLSIPVNQFPPLIARTNCALYLNSNSNTSIVERLRINSISIFSDFSFIGDNNIIYNAVLTYDKDAGNNNFLMYINGILFTANTQTGVLDTNGNYGIGHNSPSWDDYMSGLFYEAGIFNIVLTPTQILNLYNGSIRPTDISGCVMYHNYTTGSAQDLSGNENHGILQGNAKFIET